MGGILIILLTMGIVAMIALATFIIALYQAVYGGEKNNRRKVLQFFIVSLIVLLIDILFVYFVVSNNEGRSYLDGAGLDKFVVFVWLPIHIVGGTLTAFLIWYFNRAKKY